MDTQVKNARSLTVRLLKGLLCLIVTAVCLAGLAGMMKNVLFAGETSPVSGRESPDQKLLDRYDMYMTNRISDALDGVLAIDKVYWLSDEDLIAPEPNPDLFGIASAPGELNWMEEAAGDLLDGQKLLFNENTPHLSGTDIHYYLDETILVITWKHIIGGACYTFSEVKIAHPSQFRRFLADGQYGSDKQYFVTEMAASVNAVTASNGDYYKYRPLGIVVYNGQVYRTEDNWLDVCYIDEQGRMLFSKRGQLRDAETAQAFVDENNIRFSLAFGPILIRNYENVTPENYPVGEVTGTYTRSALAELDDLHYLLVVTSYEHGCDRMPKTREFTNVLMELGCRNAYSLDGGQTGVIVTNDTLINRPNYGYQRTVSDIIYFATAIPDGG